MTSGAAGRIHIPPDILLHEFALALLEQAFPLSGQSLEGFSYGFRLCFTGDCRAAGSMKERLFELLRKAAERLFAVHGKMFAEPFYLPVLHRFQLGIFRPPCAQSSVFQRFVRIRHDEIRVEGQGAAQSFAGSAGSEVAVEGEVLGSEGGHPETSFGIGVEGGEAALLPNAGIVYQDQHGAGGTAPAQRDQHAVEEPRLAFRPHHQAIHHQLHRRLFS